MCCIIHSLLFHTEGKGKKVIIEPLEDTGSQLKPTDDDDKEEEVEEEKVVIEKIKRKTFPGTLAQGVRVRSSPSLNGTSIGIIKPGDNLSYTEEVWPECHVTEQSCHVHNHFLIDLYFYWNMDKADC